MMTPERKEELRKILLTWDGKGPKVKEEALQELLDERYEDGLADARDACAQEQAGADL